MQRWPTSVYLLLIIFAVTAVWGASVSCGFTPDDYVFFQVLSPIRGIGDVFAAFWRFDPNPQYWRPLANATYSFNFLLFGWTASGYHLTNIVLHAITACTVFFFTKRFFSLSPISAFLIALFFGITASHDSNLLWISARTDIIVMLMMMSTLFAASKAIEKNSKVWGAVAYLSYLFALASKENAIITLGLLPLLVWSNSIIELWQKKKVVVIRLLPYLVISILFILLRSNFTVPLSEMQPLTAEGSHSVVAFMRNTIYSIGYMILPVDFKTASVLIARYSLYGYVLAALGIGSLVFVILKGKKGHILARLYKPTVLLVIAGLVAFQSFERWRLYFPSVGLLAIVAIMLQFQWAEHKKPGRIILSTVLLAFFSFHALQAVSSVTTWNAAAIQFRGYEDDIKTILRTHPERPIKFNLITTPTKLSGAPLIQHAINFVAIKAESELKQYPEMAFGDLTRSIETVDLGTNLNIFALNDATGFSDLQIEKVDQGVYHIRSLNPNTVLLSPFLLQTKGVAARDHMMREGEVYETEGATVKIVTAFGAFATDVIMTIKDSVGLPIYFDGQHIRELR